MKFPPAVLEEIRARLPVSAVVGKRVRLKKAGREWKGLSPFNAEKTPSFYVNDQKQFYHCFSSGKHGDIFTFLMETEGLSFPEAVERLAGEAGVTLPKVTPRTRRSRRTEAQGAARGDGAGGRLLRGRAEGRARRRGAAPTLDRRGLGGETRSALPASATRRPSATPCATISPARASTGELMVELGLLVAGEDDRRALRPLPRPGHVPDQRRRAAGSSPSAAGR